MTKFSMRACYWGGGVRPQASMVPRSPRVSDLSLKVETPTKDHTEVCRVIILLNNEAGASQRVSMKLPQGRRASQIIETITNEAKSNPKWRRFLDLSGHELEFIESQHNSGEITPVTVPSASDFIKFNIYKCEYSPTHGRCQRLLTPETEGDKPTSEDCLYFVPRSEQPQLIVELDCGHMAGGSPVRPETLEQQCRMLRNHDAYKTYRFSPPKIHFFLTYPGFGKFADALKELRNVGITPLKCNHFPNVYEDDLATTASFKFCTVIKELGVSRSDKLRHLSKLISAVIDAMVENGCNALAEVDVVMETIRAKTDAFTGKLGPSCYTSPRAVSRGEPNGLQISFDHWPVGVCLFSDESVAVQEEEFLTAANLINAQHYERHVNFMGSRRVPLFGLLFTGPYIQFVGLCVTPAHEVVFHRFTDIVSLVNQSEDTMDRERFFLAALQAFVMSCVEVAQHHSALPVLCSRESYEKARNELSVPVYKSFKVAGTLHELVYMRNSEPYSVWISVQGTQLLRATSPQLPGRELYVKFCPRYGEDAHSFLARRGWAPRLHYVEVVPGGLLMIVMDKSPGCLLSSAVTRFLDNHPRATFDQVKDAFAPYLAQLQEILARLHKRGFVHGDVRAPNVLIDDHHSGLIQLRAPNSYVMPESADLGVGVRLHLIDFDWSGPINEARYPTLLNRKTYFPPDAQRGGLIKPEHDMNMLSMILNMPYEIWQETRRRS
eukprot:Blabericola_migrator_1__271@NODE_106_length_14174_cov_318_190118_g94_i0_p1_GENE_NODE_106_length_14174_cov_318_190118_g94_i0NODE_106_length_14174_cov_318_190118_g94_i0_p1_ORF_typecomplete_len721_score100_52Pkinase/PF00069_25/2_2e02Pkinase/PF00069_25/7_6e08Kdo/PF06293_14/7_8e08WaaY/PF06176_11/4_3e06APH/PF01636_23/3_7e05Kinaselike/PF14531_6/4_6e02Kinaselike/PF14531_6/0_0004Pkinase_Tyr/PF07714_17/1_9e02Pkinase_Tyr/PF07714_17/0_00058RIO1/PF01163_22/0_00016Pkinase_fungal/PF17667_1/1e03Pkinase_fungal/P